MRWLDRWYEWECKFPTLCVILTMTVAAILIMHVIIIFVTWGARWNPSLWEPESRFLWLIFVGCISAFLSAIRICNRKGFD